LGSGFIGNDNFNDSLLVDAFLRILAGRREVLLFSKADKSF